uniref:Uncharacterized protein n=1 Tax=Moorena producens (strain JHB) TaxID=1454205 RepID=A0A1D9FZC1_MOOP1
MTSQETGASSYASSALGQGVYGEVKLVKLRYSQRDDFSEAKPTRTRKRAWGKTNSFSLCPSGEGVIPSKHVTRSSPTALGCSGIKFSCIYLHLTQGISKASTVQGDNRISEFTYGLLC